MRVTVESPRDTIVLSDEGGWPWTGWWLDEDGVEGWYGVPAPRVDVEDIPQQHGSYWPGLILASRRIVTLRGGYTSPSSSLDAATAHRRINDLTGLPLTLSVDDGAGPLWAAGFISAEIRTTRLWNEQEYQFTLIITCPDPVKYGVPVTLPVVGGAVRVENQGTADVWPVFDVAGQVSVLRAVLGDRVLEWQGSANGLHLDARDGLPLTPEGVEVGKLTWDDLFQVPPGVSTIQVATVPAGRPVTVTVRSGWK